MLTLNAYPSVVRNYSLNVNECLITNVDDSLFPTAVFSENEDNLQNVTKY
jgi:hypothetical protein